MGLTKSYDEFMANAELQRCIFDRMNVLNPDDSVAFWNAVNVDVALGKVRVEKNDKFVYVDKIAEFVIEHKPLPVLGYTNQTTDKTDRVNKMKLQEEKILRMLDAMKDDPEIDQRWLATGRTDLEKAFMSINRSVFKPRRIDLPDHAAYGEKEI